MSKKIQDVNDLNSVEEAFGTIRSTNIQPVENVDGRCHTVVVGGGGIWIYGYAGVIDDMFSDDDLKYINNFIGTSAGAIVCLLLACCAKKRYILEKIEQFDIKKVQDKSKCEIINIYNVVKHFGYNKGDVALEWIEDIVEELSGSRTLTFKQLYKKFGKNLVVTGCNVSRNTFNYFNRLTDPNMKVADAVRISMSIPFFFRPYIHEGDLYIDGGLTMNYPIAFTTTDMYKLLNDYDPEIVGPTDSRVNLEKAHQNLYDLSADVSSKDPMYQTYILNRTVGIKTFSKRSLNYIYPDSIPSARRDLNIISFIKEIINMSTNATLREYIDDEMWKRTIRIDSTQYSSTDFDLTKEDIQTIFNMGVNASRKFRGLPAEDSVVTSNVSKTSDYTDDDSSSSKSSVYADKYGYGPDSFTHSTDTPAINSTENIHSDTNTNDSQSQMMFTYTASVLLNELTNMDNNGHNTCGDHDTFSDVGDGDCGL